MAKRRVLRSRKKSRGERNRSKNTLRIKRTKRKNTLRRKSVKRTLRRKSVKRKNTLKRKKLLKKFRGGSPGKKEKEKELVEAATKLPAAPAPAPATPPPAPAPAPGPATPPEPAPAQDDASGSSWPTWNEEKNKELLKAADKGDHDKVWKLVDTDNSMMAIQERYQRADKDATDSDGNTPLHLAIKKNHFECVLILVAYGADKTKKNNSGETALSLVTGSSANSDIVGLLEAFQITDVEAKRFWTYSDWGLRYETEDETYWRVRRDHAKRREPDRRTKIIGYLKPGTLRHRPERPPLDLLEGADYKKGYDARKVGQGHPHFFEMQDAQKLQAEEGSGTKHRRYLFTISMGDDAPRFAWIRYSEILEKYKEVFDQGWAVAKLGRAAWAKVAGDAPEHPLRGVLRLRQKSTMSQETKEILGSLLEKLKGDLSLLTGIEQYKSSAYDLARRKNKLQYSFNRALGRLGGKLKELEGSTDSRVVEAVEELNKELLKMLGAVTKEEDIDAAAEYLGGDFGYGEEAAGAILAFLAEKHPWPAWVARLMDMSDDEVKALATEATGARAETGAKASGGT